MKPSIGGVYAVLMLAVAARLIKPVVVIVSGGGCCAVDAGADVSFGGSNNATLTLGTLQRISVGEQTCVQTCK